MSSRRRYSYPKFLDDRSIRLVRITDSTQGVSCVVDHEAQNGKATAQHLYLEVAEFPMGLEPAYHALSYTWGPPKRGQRGYTESDMTSIFLGGEVHDVTPNLFDAITQMSESYRNSYLWVDALCINQNDLRERELHVAVMDRIYRNAEEVVVWLGKAEEGSEEVFSLIRQVARKDESFFLQFGHVASPDELVEHGLPSASSQIWSQYLDLYERTWFSRGWVIQEVVLGRCVVVYWGSFILPWHDLVMGSKIFLPERLRKTMFGSFRKTQEIDSLPLGRNVYRIGLISDACIHGGSQPLLLVEIGTGTHGLDSAEHILLHLMRMSRDFEWSDPRDKVYSLLGLVNYTARLHNLPPLAISPDYSNTSTEASVLTAVSTAIISQSNYLGIIAQVSDPSFRKIRSLPSWAPNFRRPPNLANGRRNLFNACKHHSLNKPYFRFEGHSLHVRGIKIGVLKDIQDLKHENKIENILNMLEISSRSTLPSGLDRVEVLWRTMIWDIYGHAHISDDHPAPSCLASSFLTWMHSIFETAEDGADDLKAEKDIDTVLTLDLGPGIRRSERKSQLEPAGHGDSTVRFNWADPETFSSHASGVTWSQQLFLMDTGYLGMGPKSGIHGDEAWIISGCPFPMNLRRLPDGRYFVVGRSYIHGVMHGETIGDDAIWEEICLE